MNTVDKVKNFYTRYSYPNYPLLATPLWQYGYLGSSFMSGNLFKNILGRLPSIYKKDLSLSLYHNDNIKHILIAGSGEVLPYILRKFEPGFHHIVCLDLSSSSLKRARLRLLFNSKHIEFIESDIDKYLDKTSIKFDHIDCFGVAHHLLNPSYTIDHLNSKLKEDGTMRMMVYNYPARWWIHYISSIFKTLNLSCFNKKDLRLSRKLLDLIYKNFSNSKLEFYLKAIGKTILDNDTRFSDTFFHPRELQLDISQWFSIWDKAGLYPLGLYDRYQELTDLECSLYKVPNIKELQKRSEESSFMGNLEVYFTKKQNSSIIKRYDKSSSLYTNEKDLSLKNKMILFKEFLSHKLKSSPFKTGTSLNQKIYQLFIKRAQGYKAPIDSLIKKEELDINTIKSLIRKAYLFPDQIFLYSKKDLLAPMNSDDKNSNTTKNIDVDVGINEYEYEDKNKDKLDRILDKFLSDNALQLSDRKIQLIRKRLYKLIARF